MFQAEAKELVAKTKAFTHEAQAGDIESESLFAATRVHYERIEPIAELLANSTPSSMRVRRLQKTVQKDAGFSASAYRTRPLGRKERIRRVKIAIN